MKKLESKGALLLFSTDYYILFQPHFYCMAHMKRARNQWHLNPIQKVPACLLPLLVRSPLSPL